MCPHMSPHTAIYVSSYCYVCPHTAIHVPSISAALYCVILKNPSDAKTRGMSGVAAHFFGKKKKSCIKKRKAVRERKRKRDRDR